MPLANWDDLVVELVQSFQAINPVEDVKLTRLEQTKFVRRYATASKTIGKKDRFIRGLKTNTLKDWCKGNLPHSKLHTTTWRERARLKALTITSFFFVFPFLFMAPIL
jgi:hypothetical protein